MNRKLLLFLIIAMIFGGGLVMCGGKARNDAPPEAAVSQVLRQTLAPAPAFAQATPQSGTVTIADIAEQVVPSVVNISATKTLKRSENDLRGHPFFNDPLFREFFRGPFDGRPSKRHAQSLGSGVVVSKDGIVLTNNHVVAQADEIRVTLADGTELDAKVVGSDPKSDVAVVKLEGKLDGIEPLPLGDSGSLRLGEVVLAVGNPFGVGQTVTMGIVSALGRANMGIVDYEDFIQTDAAINPGNSGGALVNMRGELVGINTAILSRTGGYQGVGFAIPSNMAKPIMDSLLNNGKVDRGWLGVSIQDLSKDLAAALGVPSTRGVVIAGVEDDSPADRAGLERGDIVLELAGVPVDSTSRLRNLVAGHGSNKTVALEILRDGKRRTLQVTLGALPGEAPARASRDPSSDEQTRGLAVADLTRQARQRLRIPDDVESGVVVTGVEPGSAADRAGIRPGDVIVEANQKAVDSASSFASMASGSKDSLLLLVQRGGGTFYVAIRE